MYTGQKYWIHTVDINFLNSTLTREACCKLCYYVRNCRKMYIYKSSLSVILGLGENAASCLLFKKGAARANATGLGFGGFGVDLSEAGSLIVPV